MRKASLFLFLMFVFALFSTAPARAQVKDRKQLSTPSPRIAKQQAYLRFDAPQYKPGDCVQLSLTIDAGDISKTARSSPPSVEIAAEAGGHAIGRISLTMRADAGGRYILPSCVSLGHKGGGKSPALAAQPGSVLGALARSENGDLLAATLSVVAGRKGTGKIRFTAEANSANQTAGSLTDERGKSIRFVKNRVVVLEREHGELARFLARRHGRILASLHNHHLVEVDPSTSDPVNLEPLAELLRGTAGKYRFDSDQSLRLGALVIEELVGGLAISLDLLTEETVQPKTSEEATTDQFLLTWFDPRVSTTSNVRFAEGMAMANLFLVPSTPDITIAFVDHGFAGADDYSPGKPAVVKDYGWDPTSPFWTIPQCSIIGTSSNCSWTTLKPEAEGPAPSGDPTWHGAHVASLALATWNDTQGVAGVGFPVARPYLIKSGHDQFGLAQGIARALPDISGPSARIISLSRGTNCLQDMGIFSFDACSAVQDGLATGVACFLLQLLFPELAAVPCADIAVLITIGEALNSVNGPVKDAEAKGILVVAAGSNDASADVNDLGRVPCTLRNVICVGSINIDLTRRGAKGSSIFIYAPGGGTAAMQAPDEAPGGPSAFNGTSAAVPLISGSLALALSINPLLSTDDARNLLRDSACASSHVGRMDGSSCIPSTDTEVDKVGYIDLLELVRLARRSAGRPPLLACTGGWDKEESTDDDTFKSAIALKSLQPAMHSISEYTPAKPDLSIHKIRLGAPSSDQDWYKVNFLPPPGSAPLGFAAKFSFRVEDPSLGILFLQLFQSDPCGGPPIPVPATDILSQQNSQFGEASVFARVRSDLTYFLQIIGGIQPTGGVRTYGGNCYSRVRAEVTDITGLPLLPPQSANCH
jgi:hypothetical protein